MTSLTKQLEVLRAKDHQPVRVNDKRQATVLFDPKEAGKIDIDQIQSLAIEGYHNALQVNPVLAVHQQLIFENKFIDRLKLTKAENEQLSEKLKSLMRELSKQFLNSNHLKIIEYLLRNYQVFAFESDFLVVAFLAYHSTPQFIKLIQNVDISQKTNRFYFLNQNSLTGQPITREFLSRQCQIDPSIIESYKE